MDAVKGTLVMKAAEAEAAAVTTGEILPATRETTEAGLEVVTIIVVGTINEFATSGR